MGLFSESVHKNGLNRQTDEPRASSRAKMHHLATFSNPVSRVGQWASLLHLATREHISSFWGISTRLQITKNNPKQNVDRQPQHSPTFAKTPFWHGSKKPSRSTSCGSDSRTGGIGRCAGDAWTMEMQPLDAALGSIFFGFLGRVTGEETGARA